MADYNVNTNDSVSIAEDNSNNRPYDFYEKTNDATTTINEGGTFSAGDTTLTVTDGSVLPSSGNFVITLWNKDSYAYPGADPGMEICVCTAISGNNLTVVRGVEDTSDVDHSDGEQVELLITRGQIVQIETAITQLVTDWENEFTTTKLNTDTIDFGTNTITDGAMSGNWDFGAGDLTTTGDISAGVGLDAATVNVGNFAIFNSRINGDGEESATLTSTQSVDIQLETNGYFNVYQGDGEYVFYVQASTGNISIGHSQSAGDRTLTFESSNFQKTITYSDDDDRFVFGDGIHVPTNGITTTGTVTGSDFIASLGAVATPSHTFTGDLNTGMWSSGADILNFSTAGTERLEIEADGDFNFHANDLITTGTLTGKSVIVADTDGMATLSFSTGGTDGSINYVGANDSMSFSGCLEYYFYTGAMRVMQGYLSVEASDIKLFSDDNKLEIGGATGGDLQLYHTGDNSYIDNVTGTLYIRSTGSGEIDFADDSLTTTGTAFLGLIDLGTNTIDDGTMVGNWDFGSGDLTTTGAATTGLLTSVGTDARHEITRTTTSASALVDILGLTIQTSADATTAGGGIKFYLTDSGVTKAVLGKIGYTRDGADDNGKLKLMTSLGGSLSDVLTIDSAGDADFQDGDITTTGDVTCGTLNYTTLNPAVDVTAAREYAYLLGV